MSESELYVVPEGHKSGFVGIVGRPNAGKSTLLNGLMRQKIAIVTPRPQTTRINQLGIITEPNYQMIFVDTPGLIQSPRHKLDEYMMDTAVNTLTDADVVLWLVDVSELPYDDSRSIAGQLANLPDEVKVILGMNKVDLLKPEQVIPHTEAYREMLPEAPWIAFSALQGDGLDELFDMLVAALPEGPRYYPPDQITETFTRDIVAELIREQIFLQLREEVPYGVAVQVEEFKERPNDVTYISANVFVERDTHKQIVIGRKGSQLRQIGAAARKEIEDFLERKVYLDLWVKVESQWRRNDRALRRFGYSSQ
jgi:GTP-binding protein Era